MSRYVRRCNEEAPILFGDTNVEISMTFFSGIRQMMEVA